MGIARVYLITIFGLMILFYVMGLLGESPNTTILNILLQPENIPDQNSGFSLKWILVLEGIAAAVLSVSLVTSGRGDLAVKAPFAIYLANLIWDIILVFQSCYSAAPLLSLLFFSPVLLYFPIAMLEWWSGQG